MNKATKKQQVQFNATPSEMEIIHAIAHRAVRVATKAGILLDLIDVIMDLDAVHSNGCPLRLDELLNADNSNFAHDVWGIRRHLDRETGQLQDFFVPRSAA